MIRSRNIDPEAGRWYVKRLVAQDAVQTVLQNPTGKPAVIDRCIVHTITGDSGKTIDVGVTATTATTTSDTLVDGGSLTTSGSVLDNIKNKGSNGLEVAYIAAGSWVTADMSAANSAVVDVYVHLKQLNAA